MTFVEDWKNSPSSKVEAYAILRTAQGRPASRRTSVGRVELARQNLHGRAHEHPTVLKEDQELRACPLA
jgi:hypothetical protein